MSRKSADAATAAAVEFWEILETLNMEESYLPDDIFFIWMKSLFWKHIAKRSFIYKKAELMPEFEAFKFSHYLYLKAMSQIVTRISGTTRT